MSIYGGTLDAVTVDPATGRPAPGVAVYAFDAETAGTLLGSVLSDTGGGFVLDLPAVALDRVWVSTSTTGERFPVYAQDALDRRALASDVAASLATKANASTVAAQTTRLDGLDTTVAAKAAKSYVDTELGKKLDTATANSTYAAKSELASLAGGTTFAAIGNSIEEGGTTNASRVMGAKSYVNAMALRSGGRLRLVRNAGISGETTAQMLARFDTDITPYAPKVVVVGSAENDLKTGAGNPNLTPAQAVDGVAALVAKVKSIGALPVVHTTVPRGSVVTLAAIVEFNWRLIRWAAQNGVPLLDFYALLASESDGTLYATSAYQSDGTHPTNVGAMVIGDYAVQRLLPYLPPGEVALARSNNDPHNLFVNGLFLTDANADGVGDSWTKVGSEATATLVTATGVPGKMQQLERTATGATRATLMQSITAASGKFAPGDKLGLGYRLQVEGAAATYNGVYGIFNGGAGGSFKSWDLGGGPITDGVVTYEFTVPTGCTSIDFYVAQDPGIGKVRVGQMTLRNLTARGIS